MPRQAINQINVDGFKADLASRRHQGKNLRCWLNSVHCFLHFGVKVLHAKTQAIETQLKQKGQAFFVHGSGVYLYRILTTRCQAEAAFEHGHELAQLDVAQECGRTAAQMQLTDRLAHAHGCCVERYFSRQVVQIRRGSIMVLGDDFVASAVVAKRFTKRNVHVNGQGPVFGSDALLAKFQSLSQIAL